MEQIKTGNFIQFLRKEKGLTQNQLAEILNVSDKTISKWENGHGLPDPSLMIPLATALGVSVNELLLGEKIEKGNYQEKAEQNMVELMRERTDSKKKLLVVALILIVSMLSCITLTLLAGYLQIKTAYKIVLTVLAFVIVIMGSIAAIILESDAGYYECPHCHHKFKVNIKTFLASMHMGYTRYLKCPNCQKKGWCKKKLTK